MVHMVNGCGIWLVIRYYVLTLFLVLHSAFTFWEQCHAVEKTCVILCRTDNKRFSWQRSRRSSYFIEKVLDGEGDIHARMLQATKKALQCAASLETPTALGDLHLHHLPKRWENLGPSHGHQRIGVKALEMTTLRSLRHQGGDVFTEHLENLRWKKTGKNHWETRQNRRNLSADPSV